MVSTPGHITRLKLIKREPGTVVPSSICSAFGFSLLPKRGRLSKAQRPELTTNHERVVSSRSYREKQASTLNLPHP